MPIGPSISRGPARLQAPANRPRQRGATLLHCSSHFVCPLLTRNSHSTSSNDPAPARAIMGPPRRYSTAPSSLLARSHPLRGPAFAIRPSTAMAKNRAALSKQRRILAPTTSTGSMRRVPQQEGGPRYARLPIASPGHTSCLCAICGRDDGTRGPPRMPVHAGPAVCAMIAHTLAASVSWSRLPPQHARGLRAPARAVAR